MRSADTVVFYSPLDSIRGKENIVMLELTPIVRKNLTSHPSRPAKAGGLTLKIETKGRAMFNTDPTRTTEVILDDIRSASSVSSNNKNMSFVVPPFAALLVRLSQEASATADKNLLIQKRMIGITLIVLAISIAQLVLAFLQFQASSPNKSQSIVATPQPVQSEENKKAR